MQHFCLVWIQRRASVWCGTVLFALCGVKKKSCWNSAGTTVVSRLPVVLSFCRVIWIQLSISFLVVINWKGKKMKFGICHSKTWCHWWKDRRGTWKSSQFYFFLTKKLSRLFQERHWVLFFVRHPLCSGSLKRIPTFLLETLLELTTAVTANSTGLREQKTQFLFLLECSAVLSPRHKTVEPREEIVFSLICQAEFGFFGFSFHTSIQFCLALPF